MDSTQSLAGASPAGALWRQCLEGDRCRALEPKRPWFFWAAVILLHPLGMAVDQKALPLQLGIVPLTIYTNTER